MKGYIYKYTFPDGKIYIGQTRRPIEIRHREHLNPSTGPLNPGFWSAYQSVGEPTLTILETFESDDLTALVNMMNVRETYFIHKERASDPQYGYNDKSVATAYSPETKLLEKEVEVRFERVRNTIMPFFDGISDKILQGCQEELNNDEKAFIKEYLLNSDKNFHADWLKEEMDSNNYSLDGINESDIFEMALDEAISSYLEDLFELTQQYVLENANELMSNRQNERIIQQLDKEGNVIREYQNQSEIREQFQISRVDNIINVIKGRQRTAYGYSWRYKP